jgi:predicted XRE-type DNA-binding protein
MKYASAFDALTDTPGEALNLKLRARVMREIRDRVSSQGWTQVQAAKHLGISQPRVSDLLNGKISRFSLDSLVNLLGALGGDIQLEVA